MTDNNDAKLILADKICQYDSKYGYQLGASKNRPYSNSIISKRQEIMSSIQIELDNADGLTHISVNHTSIINLVHLLILSVLEGNLSAKSNFIRRWNMFSTQSLYSTLD